MSVAPPPAIYTSTNDLNIVKNIFVPQYRFNGTYFEASVNTQLPGNVAVGSNGSTYAMTLNGYAVMTLSDLQDWAHWYASSNLNMNSNAITTISRVTFLGSNPAARYTIDATSGTINVSQYWLKNVALTLSGGLPAWSYYPAVANVNMTGKTISGTSAIVFASGGVISTPASNTFAFSNAYGEKVRINASGQLSIGTITQPNNYILDVSGPSLFSFPVNVANHDAGILTQNSFFINSAVQAGSTYDVDIGCKGASTRLYLNTNGARQVQLDTGGNMTLLTGYINVFDSTLSNNIGGVTLQNSNIISTYNLNIPAGSITTFTLTPTNKSVCFIIPSNSTTTFSSLVFPLNATGLTSGAYWTIKNASTGAVTRSITISQGTILNAVNTTSISLTANQLATFVYSGTGTGYYQL